MKIRHQSAGTGDGEEFFFDSLERLKIVAAGVLVLILDERGMVG